MEQQDLHITSEFWDFIEFNVPYYHDRADILRQSQLQLYIDGLDSSVKGITREEAILLRDNILQGLLFEAIKSFTAKTPPITPGNVSLHDYAETIADIAYEAGMRGFRPTNNSRDTIGTIIGWADEFSRLHKETDWGDKEYLDEIEKFMEIKMNESSDE